MAKLIDLNGLAHVYSIIKGMLADKLGKNDTAVNASKVNNLTVETAVPKNAKFTDTVYTHPSTHPASMITGLASVATSGSYSDLSNKPTIPVVPTNVSAFINDAGYLTQHQSLDDYAKKTDVNTALANKLGINDTAAAAIKDDAGNTISTTYASKADVSALLSTKLGVTATAYAATRDGAGNNIAETYAKFDTANTWTAQQNFHDLMFNRERYTTYGVNGTSDTPTTSTMLYTAVGAFTLNLATLTGALSNGQSSVFTAYFAANANYTLTITNAGTIKYVGNASDVAITSAGLLLNIMMLKDASGNLTSIVQASKLS